MLLNILLIFMTILMYKRHLFNKLDIPLDKKIKSLSKGNKEKVHLILVLSRNAELYIFDEPIAGVDPAARDLIFRLILDNYNKSGSILISTHLILCFLYQ